MTIFPHRNRRSGIILMEVLAALAIFGISAVALIKALAAGSQNALIAQQELRMLLRLQSTLTEYSKLAQLEEGSWTSDLDDFGVQTVTEIAKLELLNSEGQELQEMYRITVVASYDAYGQQGELQAETWRYARLYQPQTGGVAPAAP